MKDQIFNEDYRDTIYRMEKEGLLVDGIITSPPYNSNKKAGNNTMNERNQLFVRYDVHIDNMTTAAYAQWSLEVFQNYDRILKPGGIVLYNLSYGSENTTDWIHALHLILTQTDFTLADVIVWKKSSALPNNVSKNKLTRIVEYIFVLVRANDFHSFSTNKKVVSRRSNGQAMYGNIFNFIEAKNNDGPNPLNRATFSTDLIGQLIDIYFPAGALIYDSFMGTGTTAAACKMKGLNYIGSEISEKQVAYARERLRS